jgi:hypothetical protein
VERFNGRIADVLRTHRFRDGEDLIHTRLRYATLYNQDFPQSALGGKTPLQALQQWYHDRPDLFHPGPYDRAGFDKYGKEIAWSISSTRGSIAIVLFWRTIGAWGIVG